MDENPRKRIWTLPFNIVVLAFAIHLSIQANADGDGLECMASCEPNKIVTCYGRCGEDSAFPCSCHPKCFVFNNCCENITVDCPNAQTESYERYGELMYADAGCNDYGVFVITSCRDFRDIKKRNVGKVKDLQSKSNSESNERSKAASRNTKRPEYARDGFMSNSNAPRSDFSDEMEIRDEIGQIKSRFRRDLTDMQDAINHAPVYDSLTGFVYLNAETFFCNGGNESNLIRWDTQFRMSNTDGITKFEDINERIQQATLSYRPPEFLNYSQAGDPCRNDAINYCISDDYQLHDDCRRFISYVIADDGLLYKNRFCFQCHEENDVFYPVYTPKRLGNLVFHDFSILVSLSKSNTLRVVLVDILQEKEQWADVNCSIDSTPQKEKQNCLVQLCDRYFFPRPDGACKVLHKALIAFGADEFPLTELEIDHTFKFLSCGLEKYLIVEVEDTNSVMLVVHDKNLRETMYVAKMSIYLPTLNQISLNDESVLLENMTEFFRFLKTFRELRKPRSSSVCEFVLDRKGLVGGNGTFLASSNETITYLDAPKSVYNGTIKDKEIDDHVTTFCMTSSPANIKPVNELFCLQEPLYQSELEKILEMCNSPCFSGFIKKYSKNSGDVQRSTQVMIVSLFIFAVRASWISLI